MLIYLLSIFISLMLSFYFGITTITYNSKSKVNRVFLYLSLSIVSWLSILLISQIINSKETSIFLFRYFSFGLFFHSAFFLLFFLSFTQNDRLGLKIFIYSVTVIFTILQIGVGFLVKEFVFTGVGFRPIFNFESLIFKIYLIYNFLSIFVSVMIFLLWLLKTSSKREKSQARIIIFSLLTTTIIGIVSKVLFQMLKIDINHFSSFLLVLSISGIWLALVKYII